jgi:multidrug efflux system membrane fusion protein
MKPAFTIALIAAIGAAVYVAVPMVTGKPWDRLAVDAETAVRELTANTVRPPTPAAPVATGPAAQAPPTITVSQPIRRDVLDWDEAVGRFEAVEAVDLRARVSGYLQEVHFKDGQDVEKGALLFEIDPRPYERALAQAKAELEQSKTRIANAALDVDRARPLVERRVVSEKSFDDRENLQREAEAQAKVAEERVKTAELDLSFTRITAPVAGRIGRALITPGNYVSAAGSGTGGSTLASIVVQDPIHLAFDITEANALKFKRAGGGTSGRAAGDSGTGNAAGNGTGNAAFDGARVEVKLADEATFAHSGRLDFVDNRIDPGTGSLRARAVLGNGARLFTPGQFARVRLAVGSAASALLVPDTAIGSDQGNRFVLVVGDGDVAVRKAVTLGPVVDGMRVVRAGLSDGDWVVVRGLTRVRPGQKLVPKREPLQVSSGGNTPPAAVTR